jgi:predicted nucleic-acid-binding protein
VIGVDTNVLVRYLTQDDALQARRVDTLVARAAENDDLLYIDHIVLCELVWVLRAAYRFKKPTILDALERILQTALFAFEDRDLLRTALAGYRDGNGDFGDYVVGVRNVRSGCERMATFDRALVDSPQFTML